MHLLRRYGFVLMLVGLTAWPSTEVFAQDDYGFRFVRIRYSEGDSGGWRRGGGMWAHDYPFAEQNLHMALKRTTRVYVEGEPIVLSLSDEEIFEHPFLYLCEPGFWTMEESEVENLRNYLDRGGFILFDDFAFEEQWIVFYNEMKRVYPDKEPVEISPDHPVWSIFYDIDPIAAPSLKSFGRYRGVGDNSIDTYLAYFDDNGRMMVLVCYNQDIGDGWEWPNRNFQEASTISFQMGLNFLIYALTH